MLTLDEEQIQSFNRLMHGWVLGNKYIQKATMNHRDLIVLGANGTINFNFDHLSEAYQQKFMLNNFPLYCTSLFLAIKPQIVVFLKNEGITYYNFHCLFLLGSLKHEKIERVGLRS